MIPWQVAGHPADEVMRLKLHRHLPRLRERHTMYMPIRRARWRGRHLRRPLRLAGSTTCSISIKTPYWGLTFGSISLSCPACSPISTGPVSGVSFFDQSLRSEGLTDIYITDLQ